SHRWIVAVDDIVDGAAEGIDREHRLAPRLGQEAHRPIERRMRGGDLRLDVGALFARRLHEHAHARPPRTKPISVASAKSTGLSLTRIASGSPRRSRAASRLAS